MAKSKVKAVEKPVSDVATPAIAPEAPAEYTVVARRYRPQQLADLIGQEHVAQALTNAIESGRIAHAYLFTGARGTGKTSTARIMAKALTCERGPTPKPCDVCPICTSIIAGDDPDVIEIDGASNNKVEEIRDLRQNVIFRPARARYKIYIIDEVHMLSTGAFNALLKTLEEPPAHVKFIFATTELQKIPITILSRCQRFDFASITTTKIFETLKHIVRKEGLTADDDALQIIAKRAAGSMRDSQTLLDQLLGYTQGNLTADRVRELFGSANEERLSALATATLTGNAASALEQVSDAIERGFQPGEMTDQLLEFWRGMMLASVGGEKSIEMLGNEALRKSMLAESQKQSIDAILAGVDILAATKAKMRGSTQTAVLLEVAIVRLSRLSEMLSIAELSQWAQSGAAISGSSAPSKPRQAASSSASETVKKKPVSELKGSTQPQVALDVTNASMVWNRVIQEVGGVFLAYLKVPDISIAIFGPNSLEVEFPFDYHSAYEYTKIESNTETIRRILHKITGAEWVVRVKLRSQGIVEASRAGSNSGFMRSSDLMQLPFFKSASDVLGAQLLKLDPKFNPSAGAPEPKKTSAVELDDGDDLDASIPSPLDPEED